MSEVTRPALRYHGGKWLLAPWIIQHFPRHRTYVEPFGGAASVLLRKPRSYAEIYNDIWSDVVTVFRVLRDHPDAIRRALALTPFARDEFDRSRDRSGDDVERARLAIFRSFAGFGSGSMRVEHSTGFRSNSNRSGTTPAHDWAHYPSYVEAFAERLRGVVIENRDAVECMTQHDGPETLHYVDPPYVRETRTRPYGGGVYHKEMDDADHMRLGDVLHDLSGMVVVSGYRCDLYDELFADWRRVDRPSYADGARPRVESLWLNEAAAKHGQGRLELGCTGVSA